MEYPENITTKFSLGCRVPAAMSSHIQGTESLIYLEISFSGEPACLLTYILFRGNDPAVIALIRSEACVVGAKFEYFSR